LHNQCSGEISITPMEAMDLHGVEDIEWTLTGMQVLSREIEKTRQDDREAKK